VHNLQEVPRQCLEYLCQRCSVPFDVAVWMIDGENAGWTNEDKEEQAVVEMDG